MITDLLYRCRIPGPESGGAPAPTPPKPSQDSHLPSCPPLYQDMFKPSPAETGPPATTPNFSAAFGAGKE